MLGGHAHYYPGGSMADTTAANLSSIAPLTVLTEEERMFQAAAREFAEKEIRPHVEHMDREGVFNHELIGKFFEQGFMGLEVPEAYGGSGERSSWPSLPSKSSRGSMLRRAW